VSLANTCGILLLDKPLGLSSNSAMQRVRHAFGRIKAGHTGSLDPLATGVLPICLGEATKVAGYLLDGDKEYEFTMRCGARTATGDLEGEVVEQMPVPTDLAARLRSVLPGFTGPIRQVPPMYSALKRDGEPLYRLARQGIEVERAAREITIHRFELLSVSDAEVSFRVRCSKGTYVRTLAEDVARAAGTCAHLTVLRRTAVTPFEEQPMHTLDCVLAAPRQIPLLQADAALPHLTAVHLLPEAAARLRLGQKVPCAAAGSQGLARAYGPAGEFLGITEILGSSGQGAVLKPVRLFNHLAPDST
jgi:tRNA pseudouridine55 synthase